MDRDAVRAAAGRIPERVRELMAETGVPGCAVAIVHGDETVLAEGFGVADLRTGAAVTASTTFQLASLSKPIAATAIARRVALGAVEWQTPVRAFVPEFAVGDPWLDRAITIGDCFAHRTGLPDHAVEDLVDLGYGWRTAMSRLPLVPREAFRASYAYTNVALAIAGFAVAAQARTDWPALMRDTVYAPLGMGRSTSSHAEFLAQDDRAVGHTDWDGTWRVHPREYDTDVVSPAAGVSSSALDLAAWMSAVLRDAGSESLSPALSTQSIRHRAEAADEVDAGYGYGFMVGTTPDGLRRIGHSGVFSEGISSNAVLLPALGLGIVVLTNGLPSGLVDAVALEFLDEARGGADHRTGEWWAVHHAAARAALENLDGSLTHRERPAVPAGSRVLADYAGRYDSDYYGPAEVAVDGDRLLLTFGPEPTPPGFENTWVAEPWDGDTFIVRDLHSPEVPPASTSAVVFEGRRMRVELWDRLSCGNGTFTRAG